ncbi:putative glycosyltransferase [Sesbania bispinosa]|nr:putative glycosyltransferase [Sesbania bispinosa]
MRIIALLIAVAASMKRCSTHVTREAENHGGCMKSGHAEVSQNLVKVFTIFLFVTTVVVLFFLRKADNPTTLLCFENQARDLEKIKFPCVDWNSIAPISNKTSEVRRSGGVNHRLGFRKNVGYLFAIQYGANKIFDVDDRGDVVAGDLGEIGHEELYTQVFSVGKQFIQQGISNGLPDVDSVF